MGESLRISWVKVTTSRDVVEIPWASREALLERLRMEGADDLRRKFEAVGTTRPVKFEREEESRLRGVIVRWHDERRAVLPDGIRELRDALVDEQAFEDD